VSRRGDTLARLAGPSVFPADQSAPPAPTSIAPPKALDISRPHDFQDTFYDREVTPGGKRVGALRAISAPGPVADGDFVTLPPGGGVAFVLSTFAVALNKLPPGRYEASVRFRQDPSRSHKAAHSSPAVTFTVRKQQRLP
jgi:hypothetical protein